MNSDLIRLPFSEPFSLKDTLNCGQCFHWKKDNDDRYIGVIGHTAVAVSINKQTLRCERLSNDSAPLEPLCRSYFDLNTDYSHFLELCQCHPVLHQAAEFAGGIHILRQQPWDALCSFILSQNNNIKRISGLVDRLCEQFGDPISCRDRITRYAFPSAQRLAMLTVADLSPVRSGFRAKYVIDAAQKVNSGAICLESIFSMSTCDAIAKLMEIKGVGPKVAQCALLFGWYRLDCLPRDVWIIRVMDTLFPEGLPKPVQPFSGIVQQYLFHYVRAHPEICADNEKEN